MILLVTLLLALGPANAVQPSVTLPDSCTVITGAQQTVSGKLLDVYLSIPYAQPPTGERRFKDPEPITNFPPHINATQFPPTCYQKRFRSENHANKNMSEDCLYLNIWTPSQMSNISVLIYIYGGSFLVGSTDEMFNNPQYLAAKTEMVVVTMNYRVGSLGFLDLNMEGAYGNLGLSDQILAFKWVKKNIRAFGGNPDSVTLYGLSAGSMSIAFHLSIKENENLFQRGFLQSGTSNSGYFALSNIRKQNALDRYYEILNCSLNQSDVLECLQSKTSEEIIDAEMQVSRINPIGTFIPNLNGKLLPFTSILDFNQKDILLNKDIIIGTTKDEASIVLPSSNFFKALNATKEQAIQIILNYFGLSYSKEITNIANSYFEIADEHDYDKYSIAFKELSEDFTFRCPIFYFSNIMASKNNSVFFYYFTYQTEYKAKNESTRYLGAAHGEDQPYVMGLPKRDSLPYTQLEFEFSDKMMDYLGNFAKYGRPEMLWPQYRRKSSTPPYNNDSQPQLLAELNANYFRLINLPRQHRCTEDWRPFFYPNSV